MIKKIVLLLVLVLNFVFVQNNAFAKDEYVKDFYINAIKERVELNWLRPVDAEGKSAVVSFTVNTDGSVSNVSILRSSKNINYDKAAVRAVYKSAPFYLAAEYNEPVNIEFFFSPIFTMATAVGDKNESNIENVANVSDASAFIDFSAYTDALQDKINSNWCPKIMEENKQVIASMEVSKDGSLGKFYIVKSSRDKKFDREILDTIANSVPYDAFPDGIKAPATKVQLEFNLEHSTVKTINHSVKASVMNVKGYDKYIAQVEDVLADSLKNKRYYRYKDLTVEIKINKVGKLKYVKIIKPSTDKKFDRKVLAILQETSFPSIPETIPFEDVTLNYEIVTQKEYTASYFVFDYLFNLGTVGLKPFGLVQEIVEQPVQNVNLIKSDNDVKTDTSVSK